jgi:hypothetical protein
MTREQTITEFNIPRRLVSLMDANLTPPVTRKKNLTWRVKPSQGERVPVITQDKMPKTSALQVRFSG